jgi:amino acid adenylation domain-containing protein
METRVMDAARFQRLKQSAPKMGGTVFSTLLAAFATLLHRLGGQEDVVIGVPAAGQTMVGRDELIGHCLNFLPLRLHPQAALSFGDFAAAVKDKVLEAYDHQNYTFGSLLGKLSLPRDTSRLPLVNAMFNIDKNGLDRVRFDGLAFDVATNAKQHVNFEIFFNLVQSDDKLVIECEYNTDLFASATIRRWLACYEQLVESAMDASATALGELPILDNAQSVLVLGDWIATRRDFPNDRSALDLVIASTEARPNQVAVLAGESKLTYSALRARARELAGRLQAHGVKPGDLVGLHLERSTDMVAGLLAIWKCGAAYVPMDPAFPGERLAFMIEDARMPVIITQSSLYRGLPKSNARLLLVDEISPQTLPFEPVPSDASRTAYVIFTSGSTGRPKGVRVSHRALVNFLLSMRDEPGLREDDVLLSVTTLSFDIAGLELFLPLITGAKVVIAAREIAMDGNLLAKAIVDYNITVLQATPVTWRLLLEASWSGKPDLKVLVGGEAVPRELVNRIHPLVGEIWNVYGPTETTIWSTTLRLEAGDGPVFIGRPIANTTVYVVNASGQPQPVGVAGELWIGGEGLAEGYHERPDLTADRFIPSPFIPGERVYRTGDLARWTADGVLECLGRMDNQVKVRGYRIELGEVESTLESHPAIAQAVATVNDGRLAAYLRLAAKGDGTSLWQDQWDMLYQSAIEQSGGTKLDQLDSVIAGWAGADDIEDQVGEWIETTIARLRPMATGRVLEIGCGTGQLLARIAPGAEAYWAADISKVAIDALRAAGQKDNVKLFHRPADDFSGWPAGGFDTVIINSVVQYFPDAGYLERVLEGAWKMLKPGGRIFLGDIQGHALLPVHHAELLRDRAPAGATVAEFRALLANRVARESELCLDPDWFARWSKARGRGHVEILSRRGQRINETTAYHYDVVLHHGRPSDVVAVSAPLDWKKNLLNIEQLEAMLAEKPAALYVAGIPDNRLARALLFHQALSFADAGGPVPGWPSAPPSGSDAEALAAMAEGCGYTAHVRWQGDGSAGLLEVVFLPSETGALPLWPAKPQVEGALCNTPAANSAGDAGDLIPQLRAHLAASLPDYMIPSDFVVMESFPLTPNGKVDRKALPAPATAAAPMRARERVAPRDSRESRLLEIWKQVLGKDDIGVTDDIFSLGADSILIFQMTTRAGRAGLPLTPAMVFRHRTVAALASALPSEADPKPQAGSTPIRRVNRDAYRRSN